MHTGRRHEKTITDHSLIRRFREGEEDAATRLYFRYAARLQALASNQTSPQLASRFDPEDVVQSVFRTFFRRVSEGLYDVPPGEELWGLLLVLSLNKIRGLGTYHRAMKRDAQKTFGSHVLREIERAEPHDETSLAVLRMVVDDLLQGLPVIHQPVVQLRINGHTVDEITKQTGRSKRTVERVLRDFRKQLSKLISEET
jgi:RNA polymerase sigma-70 factor (ECF subfamily)